MYRLRYELHKSSSQQLGLNRHRVSGLDEACQPPIPSHVPVTLNCFSRPTALKAAIITAPIPTNPPSNPAIFGPRVPSLYIWRRFQNWYFTQYHVQRHRWTSSPATIKTVRITKRMRFHEAVVAYQRSEWTGRGVVHVSFSGVPGVASVTCPRDRYHSLSRNCGQIYWINSKTLA